MGGERRRLFRTARRRRSTGRTGRLGRSREIAPAGAYRLRARPELVRTCASCIFLAARAFIRARHVSRGPAARPGHAPGRERKSRVEPTLSEDYPSGKVSEPISPTQRSIPEGVPTPSSSRALYIYWVGLKPSATQDANNSLIIISWP